jgi:dienelactone hydrolase
MRLLTCLVLLLGLSVSCASKKEKAKNAYSPVISFEEEGKKFSSTIHLPKDFKEPLPLVIVIHEWWGRNDYIMNRAELIKKEGFAVLPVDLYGNNQIVSTPAEAQALATPFYQNPQMSINRLNKYLEAAKKDPHVDPSKIFVIGYCFGGTQALNLARSGADIKGVVSFHGGLATSIQNPQIKAKVLALNGAADPMVPKKEVKAFEKEMKQAKANYKVINYKGATHAFSNPNSTEFGKKYNIPIAYNKKADEASWKEFLSFLKFNK